jgi:hypothetical protein
MPGFFVQFCHHPKPALNPVYFLTQHLGYLATGTPMGLYQLAHQLCFFQHAPAALLLFGQHTDQAIGKLTVP